MVICNRCGAQLPDGTGFCGNCGTRLAAAQQAAGDPSAAGRYRRSFAQNQAQPSQEQYQQPRYQQPQQPQYQQPQQSQYQQQAQYQQQPQQGWGQPQQGQPRQLAGFQQKAMNIWKRIIAKGGPIDKKLLQVTSLVFAIFLSFFILGIGGDIYIGRLADRVNEGNSSVTSTLRSYQKRLITAQLKGDARGYLKTMTEAAAYGNNVSDLSSALAGISDSEVEKCKVRLKESASKAHKNYGLIWTNATYASHYVFQMIFWGILAALALGFWFWKGGRLNNIKETVWLPWAAVALGVGILFFLHFCWFYPAPTSFA